MFSKIPHNENSFLFLHFMPVWFHSWSCITHTILLGSQLTYSNTYSTYLSICLKSTKPQISKGEFITYYFRPLEVHISVKDIILCHLTPKPSHSHFYSVAILHIYTITVSFWFFWAYFITMSTYLQSIFTVLISFLCYFEITVSVSSGLIFLN